MATETFAGQKNLGALKRQIGIFVEVRHDELLGIHVDNGFAHTDYHDRIRKIVFE